MNFIQKILSVTFLLPFIIGAQGNQQAFEQLDQKWASIKTVLEKIPEPDTCVSSDQSCAISQINGYLKRMAILLVDVGLNENFDRNLIDIENLLPSSGYKNISQALDEPLIYYQFRSMSVKTILDEKLNDYCSVDSNNRSCKMMKVYQKRLNERIGRNY